MAFPKTPHLLLHRYDDFFVFLIQANSLQIMGIKSRTFDVGGPPKEKEFRTKLTDAERKVIEERIKAAKSLEEIARLEKELRDGTINVDAMEE